ncbi:NAD(P)/FAD-dependent oxidoreductase [Actibacterium sp. D379-3]
MALDRIYEPAAYAAGSDAGCYWRTTADDDRSYPPPLGEVRAEFAVIGGGFTGLSAALHLAQAGADVAVLDMHRPGWGASGRNGGFCCIGGAKASDATLTRRFSADDVAKYHAAERGAVALVDRILTSHRIDADRHSHGETLLAHRPRDMDALRAEATELARTHGCAVELIEKSDLPAHGMAGPQFHGAMTLPLGFALNPRKYVLGLAHAAQDAGARLFADAPVTGITRDGEDYVLSCPTGTLRARHLLLATNGYSADDLPRWMRARYLPVQSSIIVTRPLTGAEIADQGWSTDQMAFDTRHLLHYYRLMPNRRFLFGMRGGVRWTPRAHAELKTRIHHDFNAMFPAWRDVETPFFWSGLANLARNLTPYVGPIGDWPRAHAAFAYHGNGVSMGTWCGAQMAALAMGRATALPDLMRAPAARFPLGSARRVLLPLAYRYYSHLDKG